MTVIKWLCGVYSWYAKFRHRHAPETAASIREFVANRVQESDRRAITHRYGLIAENDLRAIANATTIPVFYLAGLVDPLVPWPFVRLWLSRHCPGYRGGRTFWSGDHNVLGTEPRAAAEQVIDWMRSTSRQPATALQNRS
jgi:pimeloyl-ACP methyl ester carboxylesterase